MSNPTLGGWSTFSAPVDATAQAAFNEATKNLVGVSYSAFAVSQQVVAGMNYIFLCNGTTATMPPVNGLYSIHVFKSLEGPAAVTRIIPLNA